MWGCLELPTHTVGAYHPRKDPKQPAAAGNIRTVKGASGTAWVDFVTFGGGLWGSRSSTQKKQSCEINCIPITLDGAKSFSFSTVLVSVAQDFKPQPYTRLPRLL